MLKPQQILDTPIHYGHWLFQNIEDDDATSLRCGIHITAYAAAVVDLNRVSISYRDGKVYATDGDPRPERTGSGESFFDAVQDWCERNEVGWPRLYVE